MRIRTRMRLRLLMPAKQVHVCRLFLAALAFRFQWSWPGQTWQSLPPLVHSADLLLELFVMTGIASMSVSKGLARVVAGVETSERRVNFSSSVGNGCESVSWEDWCERRVEMGSMVKPGLLTGLGAVGEAMAKNRTVFRRPDPRVRGWIGR